MTKLKILQLEVVCRIDDGMEDEIGNYIAEESFRCLWNGPDVDDIVYIGHYDVE